MKRLLTLAALTLAAGAAHAAVLIDESFDSYVAGALEGQNGYIEDSTAGGLFQVAPGAGRTGNGVTLATGPINDMAVGIYRPLNFTPDTSANGIVASSIYVKGGAFAPNAGGTTTSRFGLAVFNGAGDLIASFGLRAAAGTTTQATYRFDVGGASGFTILPTDVNSASGFVRIGLDIDTTLNTAYFMLNGTVVNSAVYTTDDSVIGDVDVFSYVTGSDTGTYDDLRVTSNPVPEPASLAALGLGALGLLRRRKSRV